MLAFAEKYALALNFYDSAHLNGVIAPSPPSAHALAAIGAAGVADRRLYWHLQGDASS